MKPYVWRPKITDGFLYLYSIVVITLSCAGIVILIKRNVFQHYTSAYILTCIASECYTFLMYSIVCLALQIYITSFIQTMLGRASPDLLRMQRTPPITHIHVSCVCIS